MKCLVIVVTIEIDLLGVSFDLDSEESRLITKVDSVCPGLIVYFCLVMIYPSLVLSNIMDK